MATRKQTDWIVVVHGNVAGGQGVYMYGPFVNYNAADDWRNENERAFLGRETVCVRNEIVNPIND